MNTSNEPSDYMLFFRGPHWDRGLSVEELRQTLDRLNAWMESLKDQGRMKAGQALGPESKMVSGRSGRTIADGPFADPRKPWAVSFKSRRTAWMKPSRSLKRSQRWSTASLSKSVPWPKNARVTNA
jgi:hypothetical protein